MHILSLTVGARWRRGRDFGKAGIDCKNAIREDTGNYYIEAQTRNMERTDVIVDYRGEQFVIELKIWRGNAYHTRGEAQLLDYLNYYHLKKGYMLSFNFNQNKQVGIREIALGDKLLVEAVV